MDSETLPNWERIAWLADAPMFIDGEQIAALYNAVAKPEHKTSKIILSLNNTKKLDVSAKAGVKAEIGGAAWLKTMFPFLDAKAELSAEVAGTAGTAKTEGQQIELFPVDTPHRQLVQLALHYFVNLPGRIRTVNSPADTDWLSDAFIQTPPRGLAFVEFPPKTRFIPMAAEIQGGSVQVIYPELMKSFVGPRDKEKIPMYPEPAYFQDRKGDLETKRAEYWKFFEDNFSSTSAMEALEKKVSEGKGPVGWVDYRVPLGSGLGCMHLHLSARGQYPTGTFAYKLIKRGFKHGVRVIGTMKSEPAMNVLAIFET